MNKSLKVLMKIGYSMIVFFVIIFALIAIIPSIAYHSFYSHSDKEFTIPGLNVGFIPQGFDYIEEKNMYIFSGYNNSNKKASSIFLMDSNHKTKRIDLLKADGSLYQAHCGGVASYGEYIYISTSSHLDVFSYHDAENALDKGTIKQIGSIDTYNRASFVTIDKQTNRIYSGEFYRKGNYETDVAHHFVVNNGEEHNALVIGFNLDDSKTFGVDPTPIEAYSVKGLVQGMCFTNQYICLSTSYGIASSHLSFYDLDKIKETGKINVSDQEIPYYSLDTSNLSKVVTCPPMSEEVDYVNDKVIYVNESASQKYIFGKFISGYNARGYKIN